MSRRSRRSKRKLNSLFMALLLTGMLLLSSTYAWFSANKEVELNGISATVVAAEGLQISLDGESWGSKITINQAELAKATANIYQWPTALNPVSTTGTTSSGKLEMFAGDVDATGAKLTNAAAETDLTTGGVGGKYIAFDLYFKNSSSQVDGDKLQLNAGTSVAINAENGKAGTGLENCIRSGLVLYSNSEVMTADGTTVRSIAPGTPGVCIWEPNYNKHIAEVVKNDGRVTTADAVLQTYGLKSAGNGTIEGINEASPTAPELGEQKSLQTEASLTDALEMKNLGADPLMLKPNAIMKSRVYVWIEGQDVDCIDTASTGKQIDITLKFTKPEVKHNDGP